VEISPALSLFLWSSFKLLIVGGGNYKSGITMELIDQIRNFVIDNYVKPARAKGDKSVIVVSGDVHSRINLTTACRRLQRIKK
jgi:hypothetical protein